MPRKKGWQHNKVKSKRRVATADSEESCSTAKISKKPTAAVLDHSYYTDEEEIHSHDMEATTTYDITVDSTVEAERNEGPLVFYDNTDVGQSVEIEKDYFDDLFSQLRESVEEPYAVMKTGETIKIVEMYETSMKLCVVIKKDLSMSIFVHNHSVPRENEIFEDIIDGQLDLNCVIKLLKKLKLSHVCCGNPETEFVKLLPPGSGLSMAGGNAIIAYLEQNFGAKRGTETYNASVRAIDCRFILFSRGERCLNCSRTRAVMRNRENRRKEKDARPTKSLVHSKASHAQMNRNELYRKLSEQKNVIKDLQKEVSKLQRQVNKSIQEEGVKMDKIQSLEFTDLMSSCESEVVKAFPDSNSFQRLFWEEQMKEAKSGKHGMRWHPMIIRWCLYLRQTSNKCYEALRQSGFLKLPSSRTLFDYSHFIKARQAYHEKC